MTHPHPKRSFVPQAVLTRSGKLSTASAVVNIVRSVNIANTKAVNTARQYFANKNSITKSNVNTVSVKHTTARDRAVDNPQQKEYKEKAVIDTWLFPWNMTRNRGIKREFSVARTPQQNGVTERKNRTLIEAARTMLVDSKLPNTFWAEAVNTDCYVLNRVIVIKPHNKTPYEPIRGRPPLIDFMKPFGCHVTILNTRDHLGKFDGKAEIIDFLKASSVHYALTVNPIIYTSCIEQFWATAKVKTVNRVRQLQALIDKKKMIITESSIRSDLHLEDAKGTDCLPTTKIFEELANMRYEKPSQELTFYKAFFSSQWKFFIHTITQCLSAKSTTWNEFSSTMASLIICLATNQKFNMSKYLFDAMSKRKQRKEAEVAHDETKHEESVPTPSNDPLPSGEDSMKLNDLMVLCTKLQKHFLNLEKAKSDQAIEIASLKKRVDKLEKRRKFRTTRLQRLKKVGIARRIKSLNDILGAQVDASKQGRSIENIDVDAEVILVNETQERQEEDLMFDTGVLDSDEMFVDTTTGEKDEQSIKIDDSTPGEAVTTACIEDSVVPTIPTTVEETLAQTLKEIKAAKPKAKGIVFHDLEKHVSKPTVFVTQPSIKYKGKGIMQEPERPLTKKDQVAPDEDLARNIQAQLDAKIIEEDMLKRQKQEEANIALIESWENTQAMIEADRLLAERL
ncbi:uncharacterized mitochondrial protein-like protein [Tanacetum coccineum]